MIKSIFILFIALLFCPKVHSQEIDLLGTWSSYDVIPLNPKKEIVTEATKLNFRSALTLNEDSTFTLVTSGYEVVMGKFSIRNRILTLFKLQGFEEYERYWEIQWPFEGNDPYPDTEVIDIYIPTQCEVQHKKKGTTYTAQVYALYKRVD
jgi:hypothetical protein